MRSVTADLRVEPGKKFRLADRATDDRFGLDHDEEDSELAKQVEKLAELQELLWASATHSVLVVLQARDAAGKDGTISHVLRGLNPQGVVVHPFKAPSPEELDHDFLWRCQRLLPSRGQLGVFNRSHYEEVLVVRVHPNFLEGEKLPPGSRPGKALWEQRYDAINDWERHLDRSGTKVVKFFLHVSKEEQRQRLLARLDDPAKHWKFSAGDLDERDLWAEYDAAYEDAIGATSTEHAPWYVIPADSKPVMRVLVARVLVETLKSLDLSYPEVSADQQKVLEECRARLERG